jgi:hypothetical protein
MVDPHESSHTHTQKNQPPSFCVDLFHLKTGKRLDHFFGIEKVRAPTDFEYLNFFRRNKTADLPDWTIQFHRELVRVE